MRTVKDKPQGRYEFGPGGGLKFARDPEPSAEEVRIKLATARAQLMSAEAQLLTQVRGEADAIRKLANDPRMIELCRADAWEKSGAPIAWDDARQRYRCPSGWPKGADAAGHTTAFVNGLAEAHIEQHRTDRSENFETRATESVRAFRELIGGDA